VSLSFVLLKDETTNPYPTYQNWSDTLQKAGKCNSHCIENEDSKLGDEMSCPCLSYLSPTQIDQLDAVSQMGQEEVHIGAGGKFSFELAPYATVNIRFPDY
jgi:hypothetical protein